MTFCFEKKLIGYYNHRGFCYDNYIPRLIILWISSMMNNYATKRENKTA